MRLRGLLAAAGATTAMAFGFGSLAPTSVFIRPLEAEFGWSRADISLAYTLSSVGMALGGLFWGRLSDRLNTRNLLFIGSAGMVIALAAMSFATSLWQIYAANFALGVPIRWCPSRSTNAAKGGHGEAWLSRVSMKNCLTGSATRFSATMRGRC